MCASAIPVARASVGGQGIGAHLRGAFLPAARPAELITMHPPANPPKHPPNHPSISLSHRAGMVHCIRTIAAQEGVPSLWKGLTPFLGQLTLKYALRMGSNAFFLELMRDKVRS